MNENNTHIMFTARRVIAILIGLGLIAACGISLFHIINLALWQQIVLLGGGLLCLEWAG